MLLLISAGISLTISYVVFLYNKENYKNDTINCKYNKETNQLYFYCNNLKNEMNIKKIKEKIEKENLIRFDKDIKLSKKQSEKQFEQIFNDIKNKNHFIYWVLDNGLEFVKYKIIILDMNTIYDYESKKFKNKTYLDNLSLLLHNHTIIFVIVSELHPTEFETINLKYFNMTNYVSPYHYKNIGWSGNGIDRLPENKIANKAASITINKIILGVLNRYGGDINSILYIGKNKIQDIDCHLPFTE